MQALAAMDAASSELAEQAEEERLHMEAEAAELRRRLQEVQDDQAAEAQRYGGPGLRDMGVQLVAGVEAELRQH